MNVVGISFYKKMTPVLASDIGREVAVNEARPFRSTRVLLHSLVHLGHNALVRDQLLTWRIYITE